MTKLRNLLPVVLIAIAVAAPVAAQEAPDDEANARAEQRFKLFAEKAELLDMIPVGEEQPFQLVRTPLFRFTSGGGVFGSVYVWQDASARLAAIGTLGSLPIRDVETQFVELHLLKPVRISPLILSGFPDKTWDPNVEGLEMKPIASAPAVAASAGTRLTHMRALARQFSAAMIHRDQINQLRLLPQPLYRYADSTQDRDGALFGFVWDTGTDPELVLRIEVAEHDGVTTWHYQPVRFTWRELKLNHQNQEVWQSEAFAERDSPLQNTPYITGLTEPVPVTQTVDDPQP